jgi:ABC-2 type transport system permease protein
MMFRRQLRHELLKLFARKRTYIGFGAFVALQVMILALLQLPKARQAFDKLLTNNGYLPEDYYAGLTLAMLIIEFTIFLMGALYLALVGGDVVAKEIEDGTMRMVLSRPISRLRLLGIKWLACALYTSVLMIFLGITSLATGVIYRGRLGNLFVYVPHESLFGVFPMADGLARYGMAILLLTVALQIITALAFMFSCFKMKPAAATILTLTVMFTDFVLRNVPFFESFKKYFITHHTSSWLRVYHDIIPWWGIAESLVYLAALGVTFWIVGAMAFCLRDFKS